MGHGTRVEQSQVGDPDPSFGKDPMRNSVCTKRLTLAPFMRQTVNAEKIDESSMKT